MCLNAQNSSDVYHNLINICFSASAVGNTRGELHIDTIDGIVHTPFEWLNNLSQEFQITQMTRKYIVKNQDWNLDGIYPMNIFQIEISNTTKSGELLNNLRANNNILFAEHEPIITFDSVASSYC